MNEELLKSVVNQMVKDKLVQTWTENVSKTTEGHSIEVNEENEEDYAVSSDGIRYNKTAVFAYLSEKGYQFSQANVDAAAKILSAHDGQIYISGSTSYVKETHHTLENSDENEVMQYINFKILDEIHKLREDITKENIMEYAVETIRDTSSGATDVSTLKSVLEKYSSNGWKLKNLFTNELGKNSFSVNGFGVNSTVDQLVLIFERPRFISNQMQDQMKKIK